MEERRLFELDLKLNKLSQRLQDEGAGVALAVQERIELGWIYHDHALEGVVLTHQELRDALDQGKCTSRWQDGIYKGIRAHKAAIAFVMEQAQGAVQKQELMTVALIKRLHTLVTAPAAASGSPYRSSMPLHRNYQHAIAPPDRIPGRVREICASLNAAQGSPHPLARAARLHFDFMTVYPFPENNGKVARLLMNLLLLRDGYPPAVIRDVDRQRYYESLRADPDHLCELILDTLSAYAGAAGHLFDTLAIHRKPTDL